MRLPARDCIASFDVDAQCTFTELCPDELPVKGGQDIAAALNAQARLASLRVGSKDAHSPHALWITRNPDEIGQAPVQLPDDSDKTLANMDVCWPPHAVPGTQGFELIPGLPPVTDYDYFVWKGVEVDMHPYGACYHDLAERLSTGVIEFLRAREITTVLVGGLATDYCVKTTALQLARAGFDVILNLAACRGIAEASCAQAISEMRAAGIQVVDQLSAEAA
ncbi:MAG: isochorismatase family protein [Wenzhouxiangellaceae bacterium]